MSDALYLGITATLVLLGIAEAILRRRRAHCRPPALILSGLESVKLVSTAHCSFCGRERALVRISYDKDWRAYCNDPETGKDCISKARI
jgi:hypothetical protein